MTTNSVWAMPGATKPAAEVDGLRRCYGATMAVDGISLAVAPGQIVGILRPNGSGENTRVECLQGLRRAEGGRLRVLGLDPRTEVDQLRRRIGCQVTGVDLGVLGGLPFAVAGSGPPVVVLPGIGGDPADAEGGGRRMNLRAVRALTRQFTVYVINVRPRLPAGSSRAACWSRSCSTRS